MSRGNYIYASFNLIYTIIEISGKIKLALVTGRKGTIDLKGPFYLLGVNLGWHAKLGIKHTQKGQSEKQKYLPP